MYESMQVDTANKYRSRKITHVNMTKCLQSARTQTHTIETYKKFFVTPNLRPTKAWHGNWLLLWLALYCAWNVNDMSLMKHELHEFGALYCLGTANYAWIYVLESKLKVLAKCNFI